MKLSDTAIVLTTHADMDAFRELIRPVLVPTDIQNRFADYRFGEGGPVVVSKSVLLAISEQREKLLQIQKEQDEQFNNFNAGRAHEKEKNIEAAMEAYLLNVKKAYPHYSTFERLIILYTKKKLYQDALTVVDLAIALFTEENLQQAEKLKNHDGYAAFKNQIAEAVKSSTPIWYKNWIVYNPYKIDELRDRREKILAKIRTQPGTQNP